MEKQKSEIILKYSQGGREGGREEEREREKGGGGARGTHLGWVCGVLLLKDKKLEESILGF